MGSTKKPKYTVEPPAGVTVSEWNYQERCYIVNDHLMKMPYKCASAAEVDAKLNEIIASRPVSQETASEIPADETGTNNSTEENAENS